MMVAEKIQANIEQGMNQVGPGRRLHVTASIGAATTDQAGYERMALLALANRALYRAKTSGRNVVKLAASVDGEPSQAGDKAVEPETEAMAN